MSAMPPVVDLSPWFGGAAPERAELCRQVGRLCHEVGFFYVINHGIPVGVSSEYIRVIKSFFALPREVKESIDKHASAQFRGWEELGSELTNNEVDCREQVDNCRSPV